MEIKIEDIKALRDATGAGVMDARKALEASEGDMAKAKEYLKAKGVERAQKKSDREIKAGAIFSYIHGTKVGSMVKMGCETDFVAKNDEFIKVGNEVAMQVAAMGPENIEELLEQDYIRDGSKKIKDLVTDVVSKTGENIVIAEISRLSF